MAIDQPWRNRLASGIDDGSLRPHPATHIGITAHGYEVAISNRHGLDPSKLIVASHDIGIKHN
ncbi:hypothetical protein [Blastopirellula marina]|uniref:hypothetical protein n=1 Tax=Blastopirellula marina TaxID=124 RepID=UPI001E333C9E|nr:hypothetical protein [Blastopirellula marina]